MMRTNRWWLVLVVLATFGSAGCSLALFDDPPAGDAGDTADDGTDADADADAEVPPNCGNGVTDEDEDEECDDGNDIEGDGCDNDCSFSCTTDVHCRDTEDCNGAETCDTASHTCADGIPLDNGEPCLLPDGGAGECRLEVCRPLTCGDEIIDDGEECDDGNDNENDRCPSTCFDAFCGDGFVWDEAGGVEECDDGNAVDDDGCDTDCTWSCSENGDCDDEEFCNGVETCDMDAHMCVPGVPAEDGTVCDLLVVADGVCREGMCVSPNCGDGTVEPGEECDDGNTDDSDACLTTCQDAECGDGFVWDGMEACDDGNTDDGDACLTTCVVARCGDGLLHDGVESCDDGNGASGDGCDLDCEWSCSATRPCDDGEPCNGAESCSDEHVCVSEPAPVEGSPCSTSTVSDGVCRGGLCAPGSCGDGFVQPPTELCDDGNTSNTDECLTSCQSATCGDGYVWTGHEACDGEPDRPCATSCGSTGTQSCSGCVWTSCEPPIERCNGLDDDCDGVADNGFDIGLPCDGTDTDLCEDGVFVCAAEGTTHVCSDDGAGISEACNGDDDDCDGVVDEGNPGGGGACYTGSPSSTAGIGTCHGGTLLCTGGALVCDGEVTPAPMEECDTLDDDCDGTTDEGWDVGLPCDGGDMDLCEEGAYYCSLTSGRQCSDTSGDSEEICEGHDNDCDTLIDETWPELGSSCYSGSSGEGIGECHAGTFVCDASTGGTSTVCEGEVTPRLEICNSRDDDCDGRTDEGLFCTMALPVGTRVLRGVFARSLTNVVAVGVEGVAVRWDGSRWSGERAAMTGDPTLNDVWVSPGNDVWAVGDSGTIWQLADGASSWLNESLAGPTFPTLSGVCGFGLVGTPHVWAAGLTAGAGHAYGRSTVSPYPWVEESTGAVSHLMDAWALSDRVVWLVGEHGQVVHGVGVPLTWTPQTVGGGSPFFRGVWGSSATDVYAVGDAGKIFHYDGSWSDVSVAMMPHDLRDVHGFGAGDIWVVTATAGVVVHWNGASWRTIDTGTGIPFYAVGGGSAEEIWFVGGLGFPGTGTAVRHRPL